MHAKIIGKDKFSECMCCHSSHDINKPSPALYETACLKCHDQGSHAARIGQKLARTFLGATEELNATEALIRQASIEGLFVDEEKASWDEARSDLINMATLQHTLSVEKVGEVYNKVHQTFFKINKNIEQKRLELKGRKFAVIPLWIFIAIMSVAFWIKFKRLTAEE